MSFPTPFDVATLTADGWGVVYKFGRNRAVGTDFVPITSNALYNTPQVGGALPLRIAAGGNANDTELGTGARGVTVVGLDASGNTVSETLPTNGTGQSVETSTSFLRLFRVFVSSSGVYASQSTPSHVGQITIEDTGGTEWAVIEVDGFQRGQSQIGVYSVPKGRTAWIASIGLSTASNKLVDLNFYAREGILDTSPPYQAMRLRREFVGVSGNDNVDFGVPLGPFPELTDFGFMAKVSSQTADVSIDFTIAWKVG